jgi:RsiW-degrading membrane proteinase PrsW (M82 family)
MISNFFNELIKKRMTAFVVVITAILGYGVAIFVVMIALFHVVASPSVVNTIIVSVVAAPILSLIAHVYNKKGKRGEE